MEKNGMRFDNTAREMRAILADKMIPFWLTRSVDTTHGGFLTSFDANGAFDGNDVKYLVTQCRMIWGFSALLPFAKKADQRAMEHAADAYYTGSRKEAQTTLTGGDDWLENEWLRVTVDSALITLQDKATGKTFPHVNLLEEEADAGDAWDFSPPWIPGEVVRSSRFDFVSRLEELEPVRARLSTSGVMSVPACLHGDARSQDRADMPIRFEFTMYPGIRRVDVKLTLDNTARDHRVRLRVPMGVKTGSVRSQSHLAVINRPIARPVEQEPWRQPPTQLLPFREWLACEDQSVGLAVAFKGMYDYEAHVHPLTGRSEVSVTLVRGFDLMGRRNTMQRGGPASDAVYTPGAQCQGLQVMEWAYLPYAADANDKAPFLKLAQAFLYPPVTHAIRSEPEGATSDGIPMPFRWNGDNIQFSAFKRSDAQDGYILRLYENQGRHTEVDLHTHGFRQAFLAGMDEDAREELPMQDGALRLAFAPYKALTIKLR
ncbi:MAG: hypothetical protein GX810_03175 [Clostridiales bacterium]|nr:hypothetical protein [Clostridiales bacterium]